MIYTSETTNMKKGLNLVLMLLMLAILFHFMTGCATMTSTPQSVCYNIPQDQDSVICGVASDMNIAPESVSSIIKVGNLSALASDMYTAQEAMEFIKEIETFLQNAQVGGLTYAAATRAATDKYTTLSPKVQAVFIVLGDFTNVPKVQAQKFLTNYDFEILFASLEDQKRIIQPFLIQ